MKKVRSKDIKNVYIFPQFKLTSCTCNLGCLSETNHFHRKAFLSLLSFRNGRLGKTESFYLKKYPLFVFPRELFRETVTRSNPYQNNTLISKTVYATLILDSYCCIMNLYSNNKLLDNSKQLNNFRTIT